MDLELKIENFGPIDKATIQVGRFTVFAGPNNTGKTFVAKMLYSILSSRNANHARVLFDTVAPSIKSDLQLFEQSGRAIEKRHLSAIRRALQKIDSILREAFPSHPIQNELDKLRKIQPALMAEMEEIKVHSQTLKNNIETKEEESPSLLSQSHQNFGISITLLERGFGNLELAIDWGQLYIKGL